MILYAIFDALMSETPTVKALTESEIKKKFPTTGWERIALMYNDTFDGKRSFEMDICQKAFKLPFYTGFFFAGAFGYKEASDRYKMHTTGKTYLSPTDAFKRKFDFSLAMFAKRGFTTGLQCAAVVGLPIFLSTHAIMYNDYYSSLYFPLATGATTGVLHAGTVFGLFTFPIGIAGSLKAGMLGLISGGTVSATVALIGLFSNKSPNEAYKMIKAQYEDFLRIENEEEIRVREFMEEKGIGSKFIASYKMQKRDTEDTLNEINLKDDL